MPSARIYFLIHSAGCTEVRPVRPIPDGLMRALAMFSCLEIDHDHPNRP